MDFCAHVFLRIGLKHGYWKKIGNAPEIGNLDTLFRDSHDYGNPSIKVSKNWHVWKANQPFADVGELTGSNRDAEIGVVIPPDSIVHRMRTGQYDFVYPQY